MKFKIFSLIVMCSFCLFAYGSEKNQIIPRKNNHIKHRTRRVAIAAIFQNEGPFLREWIEFHKLIGVKHFYLYNNLSTDSFDEVLKPYVDNGEVELFDIPAPHVDTDTHLYWQISAYNHALSLSRGYNKWVAFLDIDEFICLTKGGNLYDFLKDYEYTGGVTINWVMYGTSWVYDLKPKELLIEKLVRRFPLDWGENNLVKSIVRPKFTIECRDVHTFSYVDHVGAVFPNHEPFSHTPGYTIPPVDKIRINHYWYRTEKFYYEIKIPRRRVWGENRSPEFIKEHMTKANSVEDHTMDMYVAPLKGQMFGKKKNEKK